MPDTTDGTIQYMRGLNPASLLDGQIFHARGDDVEFGTGEIINRDRIDTFVWDPEPYVGPLYKNGQVDEVLQLVGFGPLTDPDGSDTGVWKWVNPPRGFLDAGRIYGLRPTAPDDAKTGAIFDNRARLQRCIDEALLASTSAAFPYRSWRVLFPSGDLYVNGQIRFNLYDGNGKIIRGGYTIFEGHGWGSTRLIHNGPTNEHAFLLGDADGTRIGPDNTADVGQLVLRDLSLIAETNATVQETYAVLRMWAGRSRNLLQNLEVIQNGSGHGLDGSDVYLGSFHEVVVRKGDGAPTGYTGRGLWLHTEEDPFFVSGEFDLYRISAFGRWSEGIVLGENESDKFYGGLTAQFLNAEHCRDGVVFGKGVADIDVSVIWVERNARCGVRVYNGARDVTLRRIYTWHTPSGHPDDPPDPDYPPPSYTFEGDVVLGRFHPLPPTDGWNTYSGIEIDGVFQHYIYGPAVLLHATPGELRRDLTIRNVRVGGNFEYGQDPDVTRVHPFTDAAVKIDDGEYQGLVIERVEPYENGGLPRRYPGTDPDSVVALINRPQLAARLVYSGPYDAQYAYGIYETQGPTVARRGLTHTAATRSSTTTRCTTGSS